MSRRQRGGAQTNRNCSMTSTPPINPLAGKPAPPAMLVDLPKLITAYYTERPDPAVAAQRVAFGTSGHRGVSFEASFNEAHVLAMTQAICAYRKQQGITGPLFLGFDTHALSAPAFASALEVLAAQRRRGDDRQATTSTRRRPRCRTPS